MRPADLGAVRLTYLVFAVVVTPVLLVAGGVLTIWQALRPLATGLLVGAGLGLIGVTALAVVLTRPVLG